MKLGDNMIREQIESSMTLFSKQERKVADYVLIHLEAIQSTRLKPLSLEVKVSEATILRFCRKLGFDGYQTFQIELIREFAKPTTPSTFFEGEIAFDDDINMIAQKLISNYQSILTQTYEQLDFEIIRHIVQRMHQAKKVRVYAVGLSAASLVDIKTRFFRIADHIQFILDSYQMVVDAAMLTKDDLVIIQSNSGSTRDLMDVLNMVKSKGIEVVVISRNQHSYLKQHADYFIKSTSLDYELVGGSIFQKISQQYIMDIIYFEYMKEVNLSKKEQLETVLQSLKTVKDW